MTFLLALNTYDLMNVHQTERTWCEVITTKKYLNKYQFERKKNQNKNNLGTIDIYNLKSRDVMKKNSVRRFMQKKNALIINQIVWINAVWLASRKEFYFLYVV